jgi:hypothetical protein
MMASPCGVVGPSEVVTPPRSRLSPNPRVGRGGDLLPESRSSPSPGVGRGRDRLPELRLSPSPGVGRGRDRRPRRGRVRAWGSGEAEIVVRGEVESEPWGRARQRPSSGVEAESEPGGRARQRSSSEARSSPSPGVGRGGDRRPRRGRVRALGSGEAEIIVRGEVESEPWGRARQRFLWHPRLDLVVVSLSLAGGTAVGAALVALFSCQVSQWRGEVTAVTSALSTGKRASG